MAHAASLMGIMGEIQQQRLSPIFIVGSYIEQQVGRVCGFVLDRLNEQKYVPIATEIQGFVLVGVGFYGVYGLTRSGKLFAPSLLKDLTQGCFLVGAKNLVVASSAALAFVAYRTLFQ
jgi:hypothetical protein